MRYQEVIVQRLESIEKSIQRLEYDIKRGYNREECNQKLKTLREYVVDTQELASRTQ